MSVPTGLTSAYDLTVGVIVNMDPALYMLDPVDTPLLNGFGADGLPVLGSAPVDQIEFAWQDDEILTPRSTLNGAITTGDTVLTVAAGDRTKFSTGDAVRVMKAAASEVMRVTGYGVTAATLLVTRALAGTATNYASGADLLVVGTALAEGSDPEDPRVIDRTKNTNVTQIFGPTAVLMSRTAQKVPRYGVPNEFTHQLMKRIQENAIAREQAFLYGLRFNSTTTEIRTTGGVDFFITTNEDSTSTQLTVLKIQERQQKCYNFGGSPDQLWANPASLVDLNDIANTSIVRTELVDTARGRRRVQVVWTEHGPVTIVRNRWIAPIHSFLVKRENIRRRIIDPLLMERLAKTGDSDKVQIVCEEGLQVKGQQHMAKFSALGYSA